MTRQARISEFSLWLNTVDEPKFIRAREDFYRVSELAKQFANLPEVKLEFENGTSVADRVTKACKLRLPDVDQLIFRSLQFHDPQGTKIVCCFVCRTIFKGQKTAKLMIRHVLTDGHLCKLGKLLRINVECLKNTLVCPVEGCGHLVSGERVDGLNLHYKTIHLNYPSSKRLTDKDKKDFKRLMEAMENSSSTHADGPEVKDRNVEDDKRGSSTAKLDGNTSRSSCSEPAHAESPPWAPTRSMIDTQNANSRLAPRLHDRIPGIPETTAACTHKRPRSASSPSPSPTSVTTINIDDNYGEESDDRGVSFRAAVQARKQDIRRGHERGRLRTRTPIRVSKPEFEAYIPYFPPPRARCGSIKGFEGSTSSMSTQPHPPRPYHPNIASHPTVLHLSNFIV